MTEARVMTHSSSWVVLRNLNDIYKNELETGYVIKVLFSSYVSFCVWDLIFYFLYSLIVSLFLVFNYEFLVYSVFISCIIGFSV